MLKDVGMPQVELLHFDTLHLILHHLGLIFHQLGLRLNQSPSNLHILQWESMQSGRLEDEDRIWQRKKEKWKGQEMVSKTKNSRRSEKGGRKKEQEEGRILKA